MALFRRKTRPVRVGNLTIGGDAPVLVQTMVKALPDDVEEILRQVREAAELGCELIRLAVPNEAALKPFAEVKRQSPLPLVADIHFSHRLALGAIEAGADKVRLNPGNLRDWEGIAEVVAAAKAKKIPLRIGVNSGSIRPRDQEPDPREMAELLAEETLGYARRIERDLGFGEMVLSLKASEPSVTLAANRIAAKETDYPLHLGVTAAGPGEEALLKSAIGIGGLLAEGIGDAIRLSFTGSPASEVRAGKALLRAAGLLRDRVEVV
ncbi:MAG: flavodoxin-dependent (E)-4-hydroxy-3-methylbut-2-enyl-diphosphate synthase, partial [Planctomycetota bacterium]